MKYIMMMFVTAILLLVGCEYESPLTKEHNIAVDPAVLGVWEPIQVNDDKTKNDERMMILKYSDTEYLIHYPPGGNDEAYYRGYPIKIGGVSCVQLQIIGTADGPFKKNEKGLFHVASYHLTDGQLEIKLLNTDLVDDSLKTTDGLREAFLKHKENKELFNDPGVFRKIKK
ncbi:MAG: hypothetical protein K8S13_18810 [Desulfobacula sp.]|uniref:hypothetical protein n=1 Tax=Desulfobacula sp. TaxID=2593537 RepID=UPI0025BFC03D|nr:hypothetical protein [Desulfobacula sp.]MCD4721887.1 hypothetical protein [Desulfobacula sp.]